MSNKIIKLAFATVCMLSFNSEVMLSNACAKPLQEVTNSRVYRKALGSRDKRATAKEYYTKKWFDPGTFYGQIFLREDGYQFLYDWLEIPHQIYSPVETRTKKEAEYFKTTRTYLDDKSKAIKITILIPHPRSIEAIHQGLVEEFNQYHQLDASIIKKSEIALGEQKGILYQLADAQCSVLIQNAKESLIEARVESCNQEKNLVNFVKSLNLTLFNQRLMS